MNMIKFALIGLLSFGSLFGAVEKKETVPSPRDEFLSLLVDKARQYSDAAENGISKAYEIVKQEAPETMKEFIKWRIFYHSAQIFSCAILIVCCYFSWKFGIKYVEDSGGMSFVFPIVFSIILTIAIFGYYGDHAIRLMQVIVAPRIYLIEQAANLLK